MLFLTTRSNFNMPSLVKSCCIDQQCSINWPVWHFESLSLKDCLSASGFHSDSNENLKLMYITVLAVLLFFILCFPFFLSIYSRATIEVRTLSSMLSVLALGFHFNRLLIRIIGNVALKKVFSSPNKLCFQMLFYYILLKFCHTLAGSCTVLIHHVLSLYTCK